MSTDFRFNREGLDQCCMGNLMTELYRRQHVGEIVMEEGATFSCECGKKMICEMGEHGQIRWGLKTEE